MEKQAKSRKPLLVGVIVAVVVLAALLALLLTQCFGGQPDDTTPSTTVGGTTAPVDQVIDLYWNVDRKNYMDSTNPDAGVTNRPLHEDGYYHVIFAHNGEQIDVPIVDRRLLTRIDAGDLMTLVFDENGVVVDATLIDNLPVQVIGANWFIQSFGGTTVKINSSSALDGMEEMFKYDKENTKIYDMSGMSEFIGAPTVLQKDDCIITVASEDGKDILYIFVIGREGIFKTKVAYCQHCKEDKTWENWFYTDSAPTKDGHYYLETDIQLKGTAQVAESAKLCLDLNGYTITGAKNRRVYTTFNAAAELAVMDNSEAQTGKVKAQGSRMDQGGVLWARYGIISVYAGTFDASAITTKQDGTCICVEPGAMLNIYGGKIIGGTAVLREDKQQGQGGAICVRSNKTASATFNMYGGEVVGGKSENQGGNVFLSGERTTFNMYGGTIRGGTSLKSDGGNLFATSKVTVNISGGTITGGTGVNSGNVTINAGTTLNMTGGTITGGKIRDAEGNYSDSAATRNLRITNSYFNMYGGKIAGYVDSQDTNAKDEYNTTVYVASTAQITGAAAGHNNLKLGNNVIFKVGKLSKSAKIGVSVPKPGTFSANAVSESVLANFSSDKARYEIGLDEESKLTTIFDPEKSVQVHCVCGDPNGTGTLCAEEGHIQHKWYVWINPDVAPFLEGYWYMDEDLNLSAGNHIYYGDKADTADKVDPFGTATGIIGRVDYAEKDTDSVIKEGNVKVFVDLNGKTITGRTGHRVWRIENNDGNCLTITDTSADKAGKVVAASYANNTNPGMILWHQGGKVSTYIYAGTFDASRSNIVKYTNGGALALAGKTTIYGGTIIGAESTEIANATIGNTGTLVLNGINDTIEIINTSERLDAFQFTGGKKQTISGSIKFDRVYMNGGRLVPVNLAADSSIGVDAAAYGRVTSGDSSAYIANFHAVDAGEAIKLNDDKTLALVGPNNEGLNDEGPHPSHCVCGGSDAHCTLDEHAKIAGEWFPWDGKSAITESGNYYLSENITSVQQWLGVAGEECVINLCLNGFNITSSNRALAIRSNATVNIMNCSKTEGTITGNGDNKYQAGVIYMTGNGTLNIYDRVNLVAEEKNLISQGGAINASAGDKICLYGGSISGRKVIGKSADENAHFAGQGGTIFLGGGAELYIHDGVINGGETTLQGGAIYMGGNAELHMTGGVINAGKASEGAAVYAVGAVVDIGGTAKVAGGRLYTQSCEITLSGAPAIDELYLKNDTRIAIDALQKDGKIGIALGTGTGFFTGIATSDDVVNAFTSINADYVVKMSQEKTVALVEKGHTGDLVDPNPPEPEAPPRDPVTGDMTHCICGAETEMGKHCDVCDHDVVVWKPWPMDNVAPFLEGYWYLSDDMNLAKATSTHNYYLDDPATEKKESFSTTTGIIGWKESALESERLIAADINVYVDLHGRKLTTRSGHRAFRMDTTKNAETGKDYARSLTITDTYGGGKIVGSAVESADQGMLLWASSSANTINIWGGTLNASNITVRADRVGGAAIQSGGTVNLYGGKIIGGTALGNNGDAINAGMLTLYNDASIVSSGPNGAVYVPNAGRSLILDESWTGQTAALTISVTDKYLGQIVKGALTEEQAKVFSVANLPTGYQLVHKADGLYVDITEDYVDPNHVSHCYCGKTTTKGATCEECGTKVTPWVAWTNAKSLPTSGHYYLATDVELAGTVWYDGTKGYDLKLDLHGHTVTLQKNFYVYNNAGGTVKLLITDCVGTGKIVTTADHSSDNTPGGIIRADKGATVDIYGGILDASASKNTQGAAIILKNGAVLNLHGGTIKGGTANSGGAVYVDGGNNTFNMTGGTVEGGTATSTGGGAIYMNKGTFNMTGGTVTGGKSIGNHGGNIYAKGGAVVNITGGIVKDGVVEPAAGASTADQKDKNGGNIGIFDAATSVTIGGTAQVTGGTSDRGGNIFLHKGNLTIADTAKVTGGTANNAGYGGGCDNIHVNSTVLGDKDSGTVTLAGTPIVTEIRLTSNVRINVSELEKDANIGISRSAGKGFFTGVAKSADVAGAFHSTNTNFEVKADTTNLTIALVAKGSTEDVVDPNPPAPEVPERDPVTGDVTHCICGAETELSKHCTICDHDVVTWKPWTMNNVAPFLDGYWYLSDDLDLNKAAGSHKYYDDDDQKAADPGNTNTTDGFSSTTGLVGRMEHAVKKSESLVEGDVNVYVDLDGRTLTARNGERAFRVDANGTYVRSLTITDTYGGGKIIGGEENGSDQGMIILANKATVNIWGGTLDASKITVRADRVGGAAIQSSAPVNLHGTKIIGGTALGNNGDALNVGTLTLYNDASIVSGGGTSGSIYLDKGEKVNLDDSWTAQSAAMTIRVANGFTGMVVNGELTAQEAAKFTVVNLPSNYVLNHKADGLYIEEGQGGGSDEPSAHIYCMCGETTTLGTTCSECNTKAVEWTAWSTTTSLPKTGYYYLTVDVNVTAQQNLEKALALDLNGHTVKQTAEAQARVFYAYGSAQLTITDTSENGNGRIVPGAKYVDVGSGQGAIIKLDGTASLTIYGGVLDSSGNSAKIGGAVYMNSGTKFNMYGGTIIGGTAKTGGAVYMSGGTTFNMYGGTITGGTATESGNGVYVANANCKVKLSGTPKIDEITLASAMRIDIADLEEDANIGITLNAGKGTFTNAAKSADVAKAFHSEKYDVKVNSDLTLYLADKESAREPVTVDVTHCICGAETEEGKHCDVCDHDVVTWKPWTITDAAPFLNGYWYLSDDLDLSQAASTHKYYGDNAATPDVADDGFSTATGIIGRVEYAESSADSLAAADVNVYIDLDGRTLTTRAGHRGFRVDANGDYVRSLTITDTYGGGKIVASEKTNSDQGMIILANATTVNIWGGTLDASKITVAENRVGGAAIQSSAAVNLYGGKIIGGTALGNNGDALNVGTLTLYNDASIVSGGGTSGSVYLDKGEKVNLDASWTAQAEPMTIRVASGFEGVVVNGELKAEEAAKFSVVNLADGYELTHEADGLYIEEIEDKPYVTTHCFCNDPTSTGNFCADMNHVQITWQAWTDPNSLPTSMFYYLETDVTLSASCEIPSGAMLAIDLNGKTISSTGKHVFDMANYPSDGSVSSNDNSTLIINDTKGRGKIDGSKATVGHGRAMFLEVGKVYFFGGTIVGHETNSTGTINSRSGATCTFNMYGGTIEGSTGNPGGALHWRGGTFNMYGGEITGGTAPETTYKYSGNINLTGGTFNMYGGKITDGQAVADGGNVGIRGGAFNMMGGEISGGTANIGGDVYLNSGSLTVSGDAKIGDLYIAKNMTVGIGSAGLTTGTSGAKIGVTMHTPGVFTSNTVAAEALSCFTTTQAGYKVADSGGKAALVALN